MVLLCSSSGLLRRTCNEEQEDPRTEKPGEEESEAKFQEGMRMEEERGEERRSTEELAKREEGTILIVPF